MHKSLAQILDEASAARANLAEEHEDELIDMLTRHATEVAGLRKECRFFTRSQAQQNLQHQATCHGKEIAGLIIKHRNERRQLEKICHNALPPEIFMDKTSHV